ncbi:MAG TPA: chemotaxis protein CheA [Fimbriimonadaceae bacterium]|nr:chemotaxis protein CheA [Fimbriimonadaceae bacterium]
MSQYLGVFLDEALEQLELFETHAIDLERTPDPDGVLQILFRAAHTLKGSSKAMGFTAIGDLTHQMENVLDSLRSHQLDLTSHVIDFLLECLDMLQGLVAAVAASGNEGEIDTARLKQLASGLDQFHDGSQPAEAQADPVAEDKAPVASQPESVEPAAVPEPVASEPADVEAPPAGAVKFRIGISDTCQMKGVRAILILGALRSLGEITATVPSQEDIEEEKFESHFEVTLETDRTGEELSEAASRLLEVSSVEITDTRAQAEPAAPDRSATPAPTETAGPATAPTTVKEPSPEAKAPAAPPATAPAGGATGAPAATTSSTVRVDVGRLDKLLNLVGELVTDRTQLVTLTTTLQARYPEDEQMSALLEGINRFGTVTSELQEEVMKSRMLPINGVFQRMPRMVRDLAQKTGKDIDFEVTGGETELDRSVLEILGDPLIHLLRNAVDHGIEPPADRKAAGKTGRGRVLLSARQERSQIVIEIEDDGKGIDPATMRAAAVRKGVISESVADALSDRDAIQLIFAPGFSTAKELSEISGRGVGMDIVRSNIERVGGRIMIESKVGVGSRFLIYLPLTLAIVRAVLVSAEGSTYAIPLTSVTEMVSLVHANGDLVQCSAGGQAALMLRGKTLPLACFSEVLDGNQTAVDPARIKENSYAVVVRHGEGEAALSVDALQGEMEVVIKPLGSLLKDLPGISGASILGDGRVALVVDPSKALEELYRTQVAA